MSEVIKGLNGLIKKLDMLDASVHNAAAIGMQRAGIAIRDAARNNAREKTGNLRRSIESYTDDGGVGEAIETRVSAGAAYAIYVEMGTGPKGWANHEGINPADAKTVIYRSNGWVYKNKAGELRYTEGMPAQPYMYPAYKALEADIPRMVSESIAGMLDGE